jgi:hypothetical protein
MMSLAGIRMLRQAGCAHKEMVMTEPAKRPDLDLTTTIRGQVGAVLALDFTATG